jgi:hypothetical protein
MTSEILDVLRIVAAIGITVVIAIAIYVVATTDDAGGWND